MTAPMRAHGTRDRRAGWMTALTVAAVALGSTAMLVTRSADEVAPDPVNSVVAIAEGEFGIRTYGASFDGSVVLIDIEFVNQSAQQFDIDLEQLSATTTNGEPVAMVAVPGETRLIEGAVDAGATLRGTIGFAVDDDPNLLLSYASEQLASPITGIPVRPS